MPLLNEGIFLLIIFSLLSLLAEVARGSIPIFHEIAPLRMAFTARKGWILTTGSVAWAEEAIATLKHRYRKFPLFSRLARWDGRNRKRRKAKWKLPDTS